MWGNVITCPLTLLDLTLPSMHPSSPLFPVLILAIGSTLKLKHDPKKATFPKGGGACRPQAARTGWQLGTRTPGQPPNSDCPCYSQRGLMFWKISRLLRWKKTHWKGWIKKKTHQKRKRQRERGALPGSERGTERELCFRVRPTRIQPNTR